MYITERVGYTTYSGNTPIQMERLDIVGVAGEDKGSLKTTDAAGVIINMDYLNMSVGRTLVR